MLDPLAPLFQAQRDLAGFSAPSGADPAASQGLLVVGVVIIVMTALWSVGGLIAGLTPPAARVWRWAHHLGVRSPPHRPSAR